MVSVDLLQVVLKHLLRNKITASQNTKSICLTENLLCCTEQIVIQLEKQPKATCRYYGVGCEMLGVTNASIHGPLALDALLVQKISEHHFFQDIKNSFHVVTQMGLEPHQNFFQNFFQQIWSLEEFKVFAYQRTLLVH